MKQRNRLRARSIDARPPRAGPDYLRPRYDDWAQVFCKDHTKSPPPSLALKERKKIRAQLAARDWPLGRPRWCTSTATCREKPRTEFEPRRSRPLAANSFPPCESRAAA